MFGVVSGSAEACTFPNNPPKMDDTLFVLDIIVCITLKSSVFLFSYFKFLYHKNIKKQYIVIIFVVPGVSF